MVRAYVTVTVILAGLVAWAGPTIAADDKVVRATGGREDEYGAVPDQFTPATVAVAPGDSVTFVNDGGEHNVRFEDGQLTSPAVPAAPAGWPATPARRTFPQAGTFRFYCEKHGAPGGGGMSGKVVVGSEAAGGTPGTGTPAPGAPPAGPVVALAIKSASLSGRRFCNRKGRRCRKPGVRLSIDLSVAGRITGTLARRPLKGAGRERAFGNLDFGTVAAGGRQVAFTRTQAGRRLTPGRYALTVKAGQSTRLLRFSVVS